MTDNERNIELLQRDPRQLIMEFQNTIEIIVKKYIASGMFPPSEFEEVIQCVNEALFSRISSIQRQYKGTALLKTYLTGIARNVCLRLHHKEKRLGKTVEFDELSYPGTAQLTDKLAIEHAVEEFQTLLTLYNKKLPKLLLCLKLYFRIPIDVQDIKLCYPGCTQQDIGLLLQSFGFKYDNMRDSEVYEGITPVMNRCENKANSADAVRKWTHDRITEIIDVLNGDPPKSSFDEESLRVLVENHFFPFLTRT